MSPLFLKNFVKSHLIFINILHVKLFHEFLFKWEWNSCFPKLCVHCSLWKLRKFTLTEKFHRINYLVISLVKTLLSRIFFQKCVRLNRSNFHTVQCTVVEKQEILFHQKIFRQINCLVVTFLIKPVLSRNFCKKCLRNNPRNFHTAHCTM